MLAQMLPYTPSLYEPGSYGRYRHYPRSTSTPIPGAGYRVGELAWAEQELDLRGGGAPPRFGTYTKVPLRGMGELLTTRSSVGHRLAPRVFYQGGGDQGSESSNEVPPEARQSTDWGDEAARASDEVNRLLSEGSSAGRDAADSVEPENFFGRKVGPVPYWALGLGALALVGGGAFLYVRSR